MRSPRPALPFALALTLLGSTAGTSCSDEPGGGPPSMQGGSAASDASGDSPVGSGGAAGEAGFTGAAGQAGASGASGAGAGGSAGAAGTGSAGTGSAGTGSDAGGVLLACGDQSCSADESCSSCPVDCGPCPASCGDGACNGAETCSSCAGDCGACLPSCGNGTCEAGESCTTCAADCSVSTCPASAGVKVGGGLVPISLCPFRMTDENTWAARGAVIDKLAAVLPKRSVASVVADTNRMGAGVTSVPGLPGIHRGMRWQSGDMTVTYWIPQGITGSGDAVGGPIAGKSVVLVSWYYDGTSPDKGVRVAVVNPATKRYRFALLVEPYMNGTRADFKAVVSHAGGMAWYGNYLYVAETNQGFRVFDMSRILEVSTDADSIGYSSGSYRAHKYKYVIPQLGSYKHASACAPVFSFTALDRATSPPSLVSGEYEAGNPKGRLFRWSLDPATGRLAGGSKVLPTEAFYSGQNNLQGAVPAFGRWLLSSSAPANGKGALYRVAAGSSSTNAWVDAPEDLYIDVATGELWGLSEGLGARYLFSMLVSKYK